MNPETKGSGLYQVGGQQGLAAKGRTGVRRAEEAVVREHGHTVAERERDHKTEGAVGRDCVHRAEGTGCDERMALEDRPLGQGEAG
jgi:hypothetical protein